MMFCRCLGKIRGPTLRRGEGPRAMRWRMIRGSVAQTFPFPRTPLVADAIPWPTASPVTSSTRRSTSCPTSLGPRRVGCCGTTLVSSSSDIRPTRYSSTPRKRWRTSDDGPPTAWSPRWKPTTRSSTPTCSSKLAERRPTRLLRARLVPTLVGDRERIPDRRGSTRW